MGCHHSVVTGYFYESILGLVLTLILGVAFTLLQVLEYFETSYAISYGNYGSIFFIATGFHGFHVLVGSIFLLVGVAKVLVRLALRTGDLSTSCLANIFYYRV